MHGAVTVALAVTVTAHLLLGVIDVTPAQAWAGLGPGADPGLRTLLLEVRLARAVTGAGVGASLGVAGLLLQRLTRNPLASPSLTGVTGGASLAVLVTILFLPGVGLTALPAVAFGGGALAAVVVATMTAGQRDVTGLALTGLVVAGFLASLRTGVLLSTGSEQVAGTLSFWLVGSLVGRSWPELAGVLPWFVAGGVCCALLARRLPVLALDDEVAHSLGVPIRRLRLLALGTATLLVAAAVSAAGPISFIGLVAPHAAHLLSGGTTKEPLLLTALLGALALCGADLAARTLAAPTELPVGALTGLLVGPALVVLLRRAGSR